MKHWNAAAALTICLLDAVLVCVFPLVGLLILPSLFGSVCWASCALRELRAGEPATLSIEFTEAPALSVRPQTA